MGEKQLLRAGWGLWVRGEPAEGGTGHRAGAVGPVVQTWERARSQGLGRVACWDLDDGVCGQMGEG